MEKENAVSLLESASVCHELNENDANEWINNDDKDNNRRRYYVQYSTTERYYVIQYSSFLKFITEYLYFFLEARFCISTKSKRIIFHIYSTLYFFIILFTVKTELLSQPNSKKSRPALYHICPNF